MYRDGITFSCGATAVRLVCMPSQWQDGKKHPIHSQLITPRGDRQSSLRAIEKHAASVSIQHAHALPWSPPSTSSSSSEEHSFDGGNSKCEGASNNDATRLEATLSSTAALLANA